MKLKYCLLYLTSSFTGFFLQDLVGDTTQACDGMGIGGAQGRFFLSENDGMICLEGIGDMETWKISSYLVIILGVKNMLL